MTPRLLAVAALLALAAAAPAQAPPAGELLKFPFAQSKVFPGTTRDVTVYVPAQYDGKTPACLYVNQDGVQYGAPKVFDRLIAEKAMPVTVGVFVTPGVVPAGREGALPRFNRSFEYDGLGDNYARFLVDELLPFVETKKTADGRAIQISKKAADRAIGGASSGAICAFTAAWERPDSFSRVFSSIGTYVGLRGGHAYSTLLRKHEPKALRVFLEDGENDLNIYGGDWWMANQAMERSLTFAGYEVNHHWGKGGHNGQEATKIFPDAMKWLWAGWPEAPKKGKGSQPLQDILIPGEEWELVGEGYRFTEGPAVNAQGEVFFNDVGAGKTYKVGADGKPAVFLAESKGDGQAFGPDGRLYQPAPKLDAVLAVDSAGNAVPVAKGFKGNDITVRSDGAAFCTNPGAGNGPSKIWFVPPGGGEAKSTDVPLKFSNGVALSPDQTLLYVADSRSHWVWSFQAGADGSLKYGQKYFHLHVRDTEDESGADGIRTDRDGRVWVATRSGLQVCDQPGRVNAIIPTPNGKVSNLTFGGPDFQTLYVTAGDKVYRRKVKVAGANSYQAPTTPTKPRL